MLSKTKMYIVNKLFKFQDDRYSMLLLVPQDRDGVSNVIRDLPFMNLPNILNLMAPTKIRLSMPKFTVNYGENMAPILRNVSTKQGKCEIPY